VDRTPRTLVVASICAGIVGFTVGEATGLPLLASFVVTVLVVLAVATALTALRRR
jgi:hypothetical protein